ncbi:hypothetical protein CYMTET_53012 [Cymbomonas tetramitiformis]|uniref:Uncharacterized protein n=1 Tax=Cymbomonas tetramitiformis TaxID=36881 RepID=A0AAE0ES62_9CHLO|nr:hypothetical protein CYMTET_53012 [Cymbomonas tetramitiformis]
MNVVIGIGVTFLLLMVGAVVYVYNKDRIWYTVDRALMQMLKCWVVDAEDLDDPESNVGHAGKDAVFDNPVENAVFCAAGDPDISIEETPDVWDSRQNPTFAHGTHHNAAQEIIRNAVKGGAKLEDSSVTMVQLGEARGGHGSRGEEPFWKALMLSTINQRMQELIDATNTLKCAMIISCITSEAEDKLTTLLQKCSNAIKDMKIASEKSRLGGEQKEAVADAFTEVEASLELIHTSMENATDLQFPTEGQMKEITIILADLLAQNGAEPTFVAEQIMVIHPGAGNPIDIGNRLERLLSRGLIYDVAEYEEYIQCIRRNLNPVNVNIKVPA